MVSLMTQDDRAARQFVLSTLGRLATEPSVLQRSLHAFLANGCNVTQTAEALGTHRNTLLRRLERPGPVARPACRSSHSDRRGP